MTYTIEELRKAVSDSQSYHEVLRRLNKCVSGSSHKMIKSIIHRNCIDVSHFSRKTGNKSFKKKHSSEILVKNELLNNRFMGSRLRSCLLEIGRTYQCERCGISKWQDEDIILEVDHKDGDWRNNTPDNLRLLCPNCHSLTPNFFHSKKFYTCGCGKQKSKTSKSCVECSNKNRISNKIEWPNNNDLEKLVWQKPSCEIAKELGVSDTAIKKRCRKYNISKPPRGYWQKLAIA